MKLTLGPIPFLWEKDRIFQFYKEIANTPVAEVYVGEVVCSKRALLDAEDLTAIARILEAAGKRVNLSTLGMITDDAETEETRSLCALPYPVEANHMGALHILQELKKDVIAGPYIAIYNGTSAEFLRELGVRRMVFMPELSRSAMEAIGGGSAGMEKEVIAFGPLPLAFSWRCYTARAMDLEKENCGIVCRKYPEGMPLDTLEGQPIYNINGTQLVSAQRHCLIEHLDLLRETGVDYLRIIPQAEGTAEVIDLFHQTLSGRMNGREAMERLPGTHPLGNGWFFGRPGWEYVGSKADRDTSHIST
jgi:collagenase-like PrtC family protease